MNEISHTNGNNNNSPTILHEDTKLVEKTHLPAYIDTVFQQLDTQHVEQFYKSYHFWSLQRRIETLYTEIEAVQQAITDNHTLMQQVHPSAIALASLAQLQASGVSNLDLLDRMLERGETWLDHIMQLLEHCEKLDVIRGDYTQWCEHALEGAYNWIASMDTSDTIHPLENTLDLPAASVALNNEQQTDLQAATEELLLQKLMSDEEATAKMPALHPFHKTEQIAASAHTKKITQPLEQGATSAHTKKITQPLKQETDFIETDVPANTLVPDDGEQLKPADSTNEEIISQLEPSAQRNEMKDIVEMPEEENAESVVQEVVINTSNVEAASKDADVHKVERAVSVETPDQTGTESIALVESQHGSQKPQRRGFWHFFRSLLAFFYRKL